LAPITQPAKKCNNSCAIVPGNIEKAYTKGQRRSQSTAISSARVIMACKAISDILKELCNSGMISF
jgi:hypothetical protein